MRVLTSMILAPVLAACVTIADPIPVGNGVYTLGNGGSGSGSGILDERNQRAIRFCFDQGKQLVRVDGDGSATGRRAPDSGELRFRCVGPGEPGWKEPVG